MRNFIAISPTIINNSLCCIATSTERTYLSLEYTSKGVIDWLFSLHSLTKRKESKAAVFVWYDTRIIVEQIVKDLPTAAKDIFFPCPELEEKRAAIRERIRELDGKRKGKVIKSRLAGLRSQLHALEYVHWNNYRIRIRAGKSLTIYKLEKDGNARKGLTIYDVYGFFKIPLVDKDSIPGAASRYLNFNLALYDDFDILPLLERPETCTEGIKLLFKNCARNAEAIHSLTQKLNDYLTCAGLELKRWYGASSAVNTLLRQWNVKKDFKRITSRNTPAMLYDAITRAFYGGRIETTKLGMIRDVYVYDLNSAFAYATTLLPKLDRGWQYTREYDESAPFALWKVEYELPSGAYLGLLPHRKGNGANIYRRSGRGWYYAPEVRECVRRYADGVKIRVREGYIVPFSPVSFADKIKDLYEHRLSLIAKEGKGKGEKLFKAMLQVFYGKFSQSVGEAAYLCLPWAAWITSYVRAQMLKLIHNQEESVIYFHTDAVHSTRPLLAADSGNDMGQWSVDNYPFGFYVASGIHCFYSEAGEVIKSATRGFEFIDFDEIIRELNEPENLGKLTLKRDFFGGHQYNSAFPTDNAYLQRINQTQCFDPLAITPRIFNRESFDWRNEYIDSRMLTVDDGWESWPRCERQPQRRIDLALDVR